MRISSLSILSSILFALGIFSARATVVGVNPPSQPLTEQRIETMPQNQQTAWKAYLERSRRQMQADKDGLRAEQKSTAMTTVAEPPHGQNARGIPLDKDASWYSTAEATHIADVIVSFQTPSGGWSKNLDMSTTLRQRGQSYASGAGQPDRLVAAANIGIAGDPSWSYVGTIDNDATTTQLYFLAKIVTTLGSGNPRAAPYSKSFLHGIDYLLAAQYPNGGWPQVWPLAGGYHDGITYNDDAMIQVMEFLQATAAGRDEFSFVPARVRKQVQASVQRGIECILATQIVANGRRTVWCQQHDPLTLQPASARNFEMPSQSSAESANILLFLMELPHPTVAEAAAIDGAGKWFAKVEITDSAWRPTPDGRDLVPSPGAPPIWARFYQIGTDMPLFGDRDKSIHDTVNEISTERRNGYDWYRPSPEKAVARYAEWRAVHKSK